MTLITLPAITTMFQDIVWTPQIPQQKNRSEFTGRAQVIGTPGTETWTARAFALPPINEAEVRLWRAFFAQLDGCVNTFYLPALPRQQTSAAQPNVTAAVAGNRAVVVSSAANLALGMNATVQQTNGHRRLIEISSIAGTTIGFTHTLTSNPSTGVALVIGDPFAPVRMIEPNLPRPTIGQAFEFTVEEAF